MSRIFLDASLPEGTVTIRRQGRRLRVTVAGPLLERIVIEVTRGKLAILDPAHLPTAPTTEEPTR